MNNLANTDFNVIQLPHSLVPVKYSSSVEKGDFLKIKSHNFPEPPIVEVTTSIKDAHFIAITKSNGALETTALEIWVGQGIPKSGSRVSILALIPHALDSTSKFAGIVIDEITETIPNEQETTGVTFHYDQPNSEAPQAILFAVPRVNAGDILNGRVIRRSGVGIVKPECVCRI